MNETSFGEGNGSIWLTDVNCTGNETRLSNCMVSFNVSGLCTHSQDAVVRCTKGELIVTVEPLLVNSL